MNAQQQAIIAAEAAIGENLHWLRDKLDLHIRQGDQDTINRLHQLTDAWVGLVHVLPSLADRQRVQA